MTRLAGICLLFLVCVPAGFSQDKPPASGQTPVTTINVNPGQTAVAPSTSPGAAAPTYGYWITYGGMTVVLIVFLLAILIGLRKWSLKDALMDDSASGGRKPSVSRLIALLGFGVIISIYLGIGYSVTFRLLSGGTVGDLSGLGTFLVSAAALFSPYLANQIKSAVVGVATAQAGVSSGSSIVVAGISPNSVPSGSRQQLTVTGAGLTAVQSAICTIQDGSESPIGSADVNVLNAGAVQIVVTMPAPAGAASYDSTLTLVTNSSQRISAGRFKVS